MIARRTIQKVAILILAILVLLVTVGNAPAPWASCEGKSEGDSCIQTGGCYALEGVCVFDPDCGGWLDTGCLLCKSPSALRALERATAEPLGD